MYTSTRKGRRLSITTLIFAALLCLACAGSAIAQSDNATVAGFVKDQAGAVVPNAKVTVKSDTRALERSAIANGEGYFVISNLPPDVYTVTVEASGFKGFKETSRKLDPNLTANLDVTLQTGQLTEVVTVEASTTQVQTETATVGKLVETKQAFGCPIPGVDTMIRWTTSESSAGSSAARPTRFGALLAAARTGIRRSPSSRRSRPPAGPSRPPTT